MLPELTRATLDVGIAVDDLERQLGFYRDVLGFEDLGETPLPGGGSLRRLGVGDSTIKLVSTGQPQAPRPDGPAPGLRYFTLSVSNVDAVAAACESAGAAIVIPVSEIRPGVRIVMVADPEGNWVEFADYGESLPAT